jgi:hypothetical protein
MILVKTCLCMHQLTPVMISTNEHQLYGSSDTDKTRVFLRIVVKKGTVIGFWRNKETLYFVSN